MVSGRNNFFVVIVPMVVPKWYRYHFCTTLPSDVSTLREMELASESESSAYPGEAVGPDRRFRPPNGWQVKPGRVRCATAASGGWPTYGRFRAN